MDDVARYNQQRWDALARAGVVFSRPWIGLEPAALRALVDPYHLIGEMAGKDVLCLAGAGGQQGPAFTLLGGRVTVFDLSGVMLERDRQAAAALNITLRIEQGDMRDLSRFAANSFDILWQAYSINFVPDPHPVFREVVRVLRPGGIYRCSFQNPAFFNVEETDWTGEGYLVRYPSIEGMEAADLRWQVDKEDGSVEQIDGPREFLHTFSTMLNGPAQLGLRLLALHEERTDTPGGQPPEQLQPGSWAHLLAFAALEINSHWVKDA